MSILITGADRLRWRQHNRRMEDLDRRDLDQWRHLAFLALDLQCSIIPAWQPFVDGDHALELAAKLRMHMAYEHQVACAWVPDHPANYQVVTSSMEIDPQAMRTAIVMCAAYHTMLTESRKVIA